MANPNNFSFPYQSPPPPHHPSIPPPPPPHIHPHPPPPPPPLPPSPSPDDNHPTIIIVVFISFGCLFLLAVFAAAICYFLKKKRKEKHVQETDIVHVDEHKKVKEVIVEGPHGPQMVVLEMEDDVRVHVDEMVKKEEEIREGLQANKTAGEQGNANTIIEKGTSSPSSGSGHNHHQLEHKA